MPERDPRSVEDRLRSLAARLDETTPPLTAAEVTGRRAEPVALPMRRRHPLLAAGSAALAVAAAVAGFVVIAGGDEPNRVDTADRPGPAAPTSTTSVPGGSERDGVLPLPAGLTSAPALLLWDNTRFAAVDWTGKELARAPQGSWSTSRPDLGVDLVAVTGADAPTTYDGEGMEPVDAVAIDDPVPGCHAVHGGGGILVAACGGLGDDRRSEVRLVDPDGSTRKLVGSYAPQTPGVGHWRYGLPSPDGKWVLAQWSAECEVPIAALIEVASGRIDDVGPAGTESYAIAWAPDGRALVGLGAGPCSNEEFTGTGTFLVDPAGQERTRIHEFFAGAPVRWAANNTVNRLERRVDRALAELGIEGCCGEPSHGSEANSGGMVFEGKDVEIYAVPEAMAADLEASAPKGVLSPWSLRPGQVRFTCGSDIYTLGVFDSDSASNRPLVQRAADALRSRLYCTGPA